jgi:hypothetical protein
MERLAMDMSTMPGAGISDVQVVPLSEETEAYALFWGTPGPRMNNSEYSRGQRAGQVLTFRY